MTRNIKILGDKETKIDKLNFKPYVETLINIIENIQTMPYTIGIFGRWGSGKTSFMRMMETELEKKEKREYLTVWFNAWKFSRQEEIWTSLFEAMTTTLERNKKISDTIKAKLNDLLRGADYMKLMSSMGKSVLMGRPDIQGLIESFRNENQFESIIEFEQRFSDILKSSEIEKMIIFIDDLDRCSNENAINILESIKLFLNSERCVFVLGIDRTKIERAVAGRYKGEFSKENASEYVKKIIQLPFNLPSLRYRDVLRFMENLEIDQEVRELVEDVITALDRNPREIKRFLDIITVRRLLMENIERIENLKLDQKIMITLLAMEYRFPEFYQDIVDSFNESSGKIRKLEEIEDYIMIKDPKEKEKRVKASFFLRKYCNNTSLLGFLRDKKISEIILEPYLFIAAATSEKELYRSEFKLGIEEIGVNLDLLIDMGIVEPVWVADEGKLLRKYAFKVRYPGFFDSMKTIEELSGDRKNLSFLVIQAELMKNPLSSTAKIFEKIKTTNLFRDIHDLQGFLDQLQKYGYVSVDIDNRYEWI